MQLDVIKIDAYLKVSYTDHFIVRTTNGLAHSGLWAGSEVTPAFSALSVESNGNPGMWKLVDLDGNLKATISTGDVSSIRRGT